MWVNPDGSDQARIDMLRRNRDALLIEITTWIKERDAFKRRYEILETAIKDIRNTLEVPAAECVPAIQDALKIIQDVFTLESQR